MEEYEKINLFSYKWWQSMTDLNIRDESHIHHSILFGFPERSDDATVINYCILYAKHYIYLEKLKENKKQEPLIKKAKPVL